ncbi:hypothetical protein OsI_15182 [Oryza sativa Indica Group]|uniref:Uncharacterized protein n=1 Tax=Oryza sativa subsp. indica TaxID=39946 RepID=B8ARM9_ORYSI|nr:hypothetical protein OsI_15182 [Oryza sativa Indica Group]
MAARASTNQETHASILNTTRVRIKNNTTTMINKLSSRHELKITRSGSVPIRRKRIDTGGQHETKRRLALGSNERRLLDGQWPETGGDRRRPETSGAAADEGQRPETSGDGQRLKTSGATADDGWQLEMRGGLRPETSGAATDEGQRQETSGRR